MRGHLDLSGAAACVVEDGVACTTVCQTQGTFARAGNQSGGICAVLTAYGRFTRTISPPCFSFCTASSVP